MKQYHDLLRDIVTNGHWKESGRPGMPRTKSVFGRHLRFDLKKGFPLLTTKKMYTRGIFGELIWFMRGDTNIKYLVDNNINIWNDDAYRVYADFHNNHPQIHTNRFPEFLNKEEFVERIKTDEKFAEKWGDLGPVYGKQWRKWQGWIGIPEVHRLAKGSVWHDQLGVAVNTLLTNPDSRRILVSAWNPADLDDMALPPCHIMFQFYTRPLSLFERAELVKEMGLTSEYMDDDDSEVDAIAEMDKLGIPSREIHLQMYQRSVDTFLGLPFNIASYAALLHVVAKWTNMVPGEMVMNLGDTHLYENHMDQVDEILKRDPNAYDLPKLEVNTEKLQNGNIDSVLEEMQISDFNIIGYESYPKLTAELSVGI